MRANGQKLRSTLSVVCWTLAVVGYFFQFPFSELAIFIAPLIVAYILLEFRDFYLLKNRVYLIVFAVFLAYLVFSVIRALALGNGFYRILRFSVIIGLLPLCSLVRDRNFKKKWDIFFKIAVVKSLVLLAIWVLLLREGDHRLFREWASSNGYGDIYLLSRWNARVQVQGNPLLLVAFIVDFTKRRRFTIPNAIILGGVLAAGNFAYILGLGAFFLWQACMYIPKWIQEGKVSKRAVTIVLVCCLVVALSYSVSKIIEKAEFSNKIRIEQVGILLDANPVIGEGLGNYIQKETSMRKYDGDIYFELQTLYIYNQVGLIGLALGYYLTGLPLWKRSRNRLMVYLLYLFFSFWNPYCWDMTHMVVLLILGNTAGLGAKNEKSDYYSVFSFCKRQIERGRNRLSGR